MAENLGIYYCPICHINFKGQECPRCKKMGKIVNDLPFERDLSKDSSYLDYVFKKAKKNDT